MGVLLDVATLLDAPGAPNATRVGELLGAWLTDCDRLAPVAEESKYNEMHVVGLGVCTLLHRSALAGYEAFRLAVALGAHAPRVELHAEPPSEMLW